MELTGYDNPRLKALFFWLISGAPEQKSFPDIVAETGRRLKAANLPVDWYGNFKTQMHPELPGRLDYWTSLGGQRFRFLTPEENADGEMWIGTPAQVCSSSGRVVNYRPGSEPMFDNRKDMLEMARRGYTHFIYLPLHSKYTPVTNVAAFATKSEDGFKEDHIKSMRSLQAPLARVTEGFVLREGTAAVLSTYVGREAGEKVLTGNIRRGDTEIIPSVVLFADIKDYSSLSNRLPPAETIETLNQFFDNLDTSVQKHGGEILKFLGDGAMAVFPTPDDFSSQIAAVDSAKTAVSEVFDKFSAIRNLDWPLEFRAALHLGEVYYGNIGSSNRLDFTVVGPTVNFAARLLEIASSLSADLVCSSAVARLLHDPTTSLGMHNAKGFDEPIEVFEIAL